MRFHLLAVSKRPRDWVRTASEDYLKRLSGQLKFSVTDISPVREEPNRKQREAERLVQATPKGAYRVALDEHGAMWSTSDLVLQLARWRDRGQDVAFYIGGADGLHESVLDDSEQQWSLSPLTLPHQFVRVILLEQIYRALSIANNHPYHRE